MIERRTTILQVFMLLLLFLSSIACNRNASTNGSEKNDSAVSRITQQIVNDTMDPFSGDYFWKQGNAEADISVSRTQDGRYFVDGQAFWGLDRLGGPHIGEISFIAEMKDSSITYMHPDADYTISLRSTNGRLHVREEGLNPDAGLNVTFTGEYDKKE